MSGRRRLNGTFIGFCGAGGTGKTTTAKLLAPKIGHTFLPSAARSVFAKMSPRFGEQDQDRLTPAQRWGLQQSIQIAHMEQMANHFGEKMLCDRTQIDQYVYALQYCSETLNVVDIKWLHDLVERALQFYRIIFYFPLTDFPGHDDGMRTVQPARRLAFDCMLWGVLSNFQIQVTPVPVLCPEDRAHFIMAHLNPGRISSL
jgi:hypothetical protein